MMKPLAQIALEGFLADPAEERSSELFRETAPRVFAYFRRRGCDQALAEDLTQEVMLAVFRQAGSLRQPVPDILDYGAV